MRRGHRRRAPAALPAALAVLTALTALAVVTVPTARAAVTVGLGDQKPAVFADARLRALKLPVARLIVPYDAATSEPQLVDQWLAATAAAGMQPHVAFEHLRSSACPRSPCVVPTRAQYGAAVRAFVARWPQVRTYTTWNEANHASQPVWNRPEAVAGFYDELRAACPGCTVVAGDVVDSGSYVDFLRRLRAAASVDPPLWGLHNYGDVTYGTSTGTDAALAAVGGELWLEETGGIVVLRDQAGRQTLPFDEQRAASGIDQAFALAATRPRITRLYVYQWSATPTSSFDSGLVRPDGALRPSYTALVRNLAALGGTSVPVPATATVAATLRWSVRWSASARNVLLLRVRCRTSGGRCVGTVAPALRTRRTVGSRTLVARVGAARRYTTTATRRTVTLRLTVSRALRARLRAARTRRLALTVRPTTPTGAPATVTLRVAVPR